jgi:hypothetical protein
MFAFKAACNSHVRSYTAGSRFNQIIYRHAFPTAACNLNDSRRFRLFHLPQLSVAVVGNGLRCRQLFLLGIFLHVPHLPQKPKAVQRSGTDGDGDGRHGASYKDTVAKEAAGMRMKEWQNAVMDETWSEMQGPGSQRGAVSFVRWTAFHLTLQHIWLQKLFLARAARSSQPATQHLANKQIVTHFQQKIGNVHYRPKKWSLQLFLSQRYWTPDCSISEEPKKAGHNGCNKGGQLSMNLMTNSLMSDNWKAPKKDTKKLSDAVSRSQTLAHRCFEAFAKQEFIVINSQLRLYI